MSEFQYTRLFDKDKPEQRPLGARVKPRGDRPEGVEYRYDDETELAINVALATGRPLLLSGDPGTGKTSLARDVARRFRWRLLRETVTSRTRAQDLLYTTDLVARLSDAYDKKARPIEQYRRPGILWWAYDETSAVKSLVGGAFAKDADAARELDPAERLEDAPPAAREKRAVVLLDEIDKAEPDVPNDLLGPLGSFRFDVPGVGTVEAGAAPLVIITTNGERELPRAFLRRCVRRRLELPDAGGLVEIAGFHAEARERSMSPQRTKLHEDVVERFREVRGLLKAKGEPVLPGTAEMLDVIEACELVKLLSPQKRSGPAWVELLRSTLLKGDVELDDAALTGDGA